MKVKVNQNSCYYTEGPQLSTLALPKTNSTHLLRRFRAYVMIRGELGTPCSSVLM